MTNLVPTPSFDDVFQLETTTPVLGGPGGPANSPAQALLNRTAYLEKYTPTPFRPGRIYGANEPVLLASGDTVRSEAGGNTTDPNTSMAGWTLYLRASSVLDSSGVSQQKINDMLHLATVDDLPIDGVDGQLAIVYDDLRGGKFFYSSARAGENNGGTVFNGWVRKYFGSVFVDWFCEADPAVNDCSIAMEKALGVTRGVKASGRDFLFTGRVGIPDADQSNYALRQIKIIGDGDTTFHIDCLSHGRPTFTSATAKANPTTEANAFVGLVDFKEINFLGVNTNFGFDLLDANKNLVDVPIDGDRLYNSSAMFCNFGYLYAGLRCQQGRGESVEGNNAYSQSFTFANNKFTHCTYLADANQFLNFRFTQNQCEKNYAGIRANSKKPLEIPGFSVVSISENLFEAGGMFVDVLGDVVGGLIWNNYQEYNIYQKVAIELCQILIVGENRGCVIGANSFGGQIDFTGYDTEYMDIKTTGGHPDDLSKTDYSSSKLLLIGNHSTSRKLTSSNTAVSIANSSPYFLRNGWIKEPAVNHFNSQNAYSHQESNVTFSRGIFSQPLAYSATAVNGTTVKTLRDSDASIIVGILDLSRLESGASKNVLSTITGEMDCNVDLIGAGVTLANLSAKIHVSIISTGFGASSAQQYDEVRVNAKILSLVQPYDIPILSSQPSNLMKKQFYDALATAVVEPLGRGRYAIRITNYLNVTVGALGAPDDIYSNISWRSNTGVRQVTDRIGNAAAFIGYWW